AISLATLASALPRALSTRASPALDVRDAPGGARAAARSRRLAASSLAACPRSRSSTASRSRRSATRDRSLVAGPPVALGPSPAARRSRSSPQAGRAPPSSSGPRPASRASWAGERARVAAAPDLSAAPLASPASRPWQAKAARLARPASMWTTAGRTVGSYTETGALRRIGLEPDHARVLDRRRPVRARRLQRLLGRVANRRRDL